MKITKGTHSKASQVNHLVFDDRIVLNILLSCFYISDFYHLRNSGSIQINYMLALGSSSFYTLFIQFTLLVFSISFINGFVTGFVNSFMCLLFFATQYLTFAYCSQCCSTSNFYVSIVPAKKLITVFYTSPHLCQMLKLPSHNKQYDI